ncbi:MAG: RDD family protein [Methanoregula sp.]
MTDPVNQNDPVAWDRAGIEYQIQRDDLNAIRCFTRATELNPDYLDAWARKGFLHIKMGMFEDADKCKARVREIKEKAAVEGRKFQEVSRAQKPHHQIPSVVTATHVTNTHEQVEPIYAKLWERFCAVFVDDLIWFVLVIIAAVLVSPPPFNMIEMLFFYTIFFGYCVILSYYESSTVMATIGKGNQKIHVTDKFGQRISFTRSLLRNVTKFFFSLFPLYFLINAVIIHYSKEKKAIHDYIANTRVLKNN